MNYIVFFTLLLTSFFGALSISNTVLLLIVFAFVAIPKTKSGKHFFKLNLYLVLICIMGSIISCYYYRGQPMFLTFKSSATYFYIFFYFTLLYFNYSLDKMEDTLYKLVVLFCCCYIFQYIIYPIPVFGGSKTAFGENVRIRMPGQGLASLGYFFCISRYLLVKNKKYLIAALLCFVVIFLMGFRSMLALMLFFTLVTIYRLIGLNKRLIGYCILGFIFLIVLLQVPAFSFVVEKMMERQANKQTFDNDEYIRVIQFLYYTQDHFKDVWEHVWGSGMPSPVTRYGKYMRRLTENGIWYYDWGLIGLSWIIGVFSVLAMLLYSLKAVLLKVSKRYEYITIWFIYLVLVSFTTMEFYRSGNFVIQAIALYMIEKATKEHKLIRKKQNENRNFNISQST